MPSMIRSMAVAAFATFVAAQTTYSNGTLPTAAAVPGWNSLGCFSVGSAGATLVENSDMMTDERCALDCTISDAYTYAFVSGNNCFCGTSLNGTTQVAASMCNTRCSGNPTEACGGSGTGAKRQATVGIANVFSRTAIPAAGSIYETFITNVYLNYCATCPGGVSTVTYCSAATVTACGCTTQSLPTIPVTTVTTSCPGVGTITLTTPVGVTATASVVTASVTTVVAGVTTVASACPGCATATSVSPIVPATPAAATTTRPATFTGAASANGVALAGVVAGFAAALL